MRLHSRWQSATSDPSLFFTTKSSAVSYRQPISADFWPRYSNLNFPPAPRMTWHNVRAPQESPYCSGFPFGPLSVIVTLWETKPIKNVRKSWRGCKSKKIRPSAEYNGRQKRLKVDLLWRMI